MSISLQRILKLRDGDGYRSVIVDIFWPEQRGQSWFSDWKIGWPDRELSGSVGGSDAIQAFFCALTAVGTQFNCSEEHGAGRLNWSDDWTGYGFPVPKNIRDLLIGDDAKNF